MIGTGGGHSTPSRGVEAVTTQGRITAGGVGGAVGDSGHGMAERYMAEAVLSQGLAREPGADV